MVPSKIWQFERERERERERFFCMGPQNFPVLDFFFFFYGKREVLFNYKLVHITTSAAPGVQNLVSPRPVKSLIYDTVTKLGHVLYINTKGCWWVPHFANTSAHPFASRYMWCTCTSHSWCNRFLQSQIKGNILVW